MVTGCSKTELKEGIDFNVNGEFTGKYLDITKRGYYIDTFNYPEAPYLYIICMGEKNTGGYSLKIKEVNRDNETTEIIVEEIEPKKDEIVTMAFTYPTIVVEFPKYQENIVIKNTKGEIFNELD
jgi:hypothetical protein